MQKSSVWGPVVMQEGRMDEAIRDLVAAAGFPGEETNS